MARKKKLVILLFVGIALLLLTAPSFSEKTMRNIMAEKFSEKRDICIVIQSLIQEGRDSKEIVKTAIQMGYGACFVVKCAIEGGGSLEKILTGAVEAGATSDVISRCAIDAGAKPHEVAWILEQSPAILTIGLPDERGGGVLSPSSP